MTPRLARQGRLHNQKGRHREACPRMAPPRMDSPDCGMQIITAVGATPEEYRTGGLAREVRRPLKCQECGAVGRMRTHGYYRRHTTDAGGHIIEVLVRRFRCRACGATVSCLPAFALPYHLVSCATVQRAFSNEAGSDVERNRDLLRRYWRRFKRRWPQLGLARTPRSPDSLHDAAAAEAWRQFLRTAGSLAEGTRRLVKDRQTTCLGRYRCHRRPNPRT